MENVPGRTHSVPIMTTDRQDKIIAEFAIFTYL